MAAAQHRPHELLATFAAGTGPITHAMLDDLGLTKAVTHMRAVLVSTSVLPQRDEYFADLERWIPAAFRPSRTLMNGARSGCS